MTEITEESIISLIEAIWEDDPLETGYVSKPTFINSKISIHDSIEKASLVLNQFTLWENAGMKGAKSKLQTELQIQIGGANKTLASARIAELMRCMESIYIANVIIYLIGVNKNLTGLGDNTDVGETKAEPWMYDISYQLRGKLI
jgi:hypothetical protein